MLCKLCQSFDIRALYCRAADGCANHSRHGDRRGRRVAGINDTKRFPSYDGFPDFYKHHANLRALQGSAAGGCDLCRLIWTTFEEFVTEDVPGEPIESVLQDLESGVTPQGEKQIYLGLSSWVPELNGFPYVTAVQLIQSNAGESPQTRTLANLEAFTTRDSCPIQFEHLLAKEVPPSPEACLPIAATWLQHCREKHQTCKRRDINTKPPTRLIDVGDCNTDPRIVFPSGCVEWVALSYCWGGDSSFILEGDRLDTWKNSIPITNFPATLHDAVVATKSLGLKYLWIDALCIIQDSPEDWAREAARMGDVYRGATLTISGTDSPRTSSGFLRRRPRASMTCEIDWRDPGSVSTIYLQQIQPLWGRSHTATSLESRGWTLQEAMLSLRNLQFGDRMMAWECAEVRVDESGRPLAPFGWKHSDGGITQSLLMSSSTWNTWLTGKMFSSLIGRSIFGLRILELPGQYLYDHFEQLHNRWLDIVREYVTRNLTYHADTLPALSGLAAAFQPLINDQYCAGIWRKDMIRGLVWSTTLASHMVDEGRIICREPLAYTAPSWSWASMPARSINFTRQIRDARISSEAEILECHTTTSPGKQFGQVTNGHILVRSRVYTIQDLRKPYSRAASRMPFLENRIRDDLLIATNGINEYDYKHRDCDDQDFAIMQICRWERPGRWSIYGADFMVIESTGLRENEYRRIGLIVFSELNEAPETSQHVWSELDESHATIKTIRII